MEEKEDILFILTLEMTIPVVLEKITDSEIPALQRIMAQLILLVK